MTYGVLRLHANDLKNAAARCYNAAEHKDLEAAKKAAKSLQRDIDNFLEDIRYIEAVISDGGKIND